jgi:hypothetical protein
MKCWNSAFNAQGSKLTIVVVQVGAAKIYAVEARRKKERQDETQHLDIFQMQKIKCLYQKDWAFFYFN